MQDRVTVGEGTTAHVLAEAVQKLFPGTQVTIGPAIDDGFYYDFFRETPFSTDDFAAIEKEMGRIVDRDAKFEREVWDRDEAITFFEARGEKFKAELIRDLPGTETITLYKQGDWIDLCRGPHLRSTGDVGDAFKLMKVAGAYWRGDHRNAMLSRIYGTAWRDRKELDAYLLQIEEAEKRDHRRIGKDMGLFHLQEEAVGSVFHNLYAEGYPHPDMRALSEAELLDYDAQLTYFRRYADRRYYKGADYVNILEALAQRRTAEAFCSPGMSVGDLFVNVQPLSGAPANTAIYEALVNEGDVVMGLDLMHGGHLTHGSPVNRSGRHHKIVSYRVNEKTERIDYDEIMALAMEHKPKMIIAGYTSYPLAPDFRKFRAIADACGAFLMADISHTAGLAAAGLYPNPIGIADVTSFTTHKSLIGPRAAVIVTTRAELADRIDRAVFPGEQGGPHINAIAGIAVAMKLAQQPVFKRLQQQIVANAKALADGFTANGVRVAHGGTDTHMVLIDTKSCAGTKDNPLMGDAAARILDVAGIVANRNTLPGDKSPLRPSGVRFGTPWVTQRGLVEADMGEIAEVAARILKSARPFTLSNSRTTSFRAKVDFDALIDGARRITALAQKAGRDA